MEQQESRKKTALVTGASSGIGREMARYLAELHYDLILTARDTAKLQKLREEILRGNAAKGLDAREITLIPADLSREEECRRLYEEVHRCALFPTMVINNAGLGVYGAFADTDLDSDLNQIHVNVTAVHILTKLFLRDLLAAGEGTILNVGSSAGFLAGPMFSGYYASKNYVVRLSEAIHEELRHRNTKVTVSVLCPGPVETAFDRRAGVKQSMHGMDPAAVARAGIDGARKGKMVIVPGVTMKLGVFFGRLLGEHLMTRVTYTIQKRKAGKTENA